MPLSEARRRLEQLHEALQVGEGPVLIAVHNYPDPDCLASAMGLRSLLSFWGIDADIADGRGIGRPENKAMAGLLNLDPKLFDQLDVLKYRGAILVDTQPEVGNNLLPSSVPVLAVLDHHPLMESNCADVLYVDVRPEIGATSTLLWEYLRAAGVAITAELATALYLGIKTDTESLERHASALDIEAYVGLLPVVDLGLVRKITRPPLGEDYFLMLENALTSACRYGEAMVSYVGEAVVPDYLSAFSELLLQAKGVAFALCLGHKDGVMYLSLRVQPPRKNAGVLLKKIVAGRGTGGGHALAAGGLLPMGHATPWRVSEVARLRLLRATDADGQVGRPLTPSGTVGG